MRASRFRGLWRNSTGAAALEFAMIAPILIALILGTIETGWMMTQTMMLDRALDMTIREVRIGSFQNPTLERVRNRVCERAVVLADCQASLALEFLPIASKADYPTDSTRCMTRGSDPRPVLRFSIGNREQLVFVRACFIVAPITPMLAVLLSLPGDERGEHRLIAKSGFMNEPA
ncbi:TadE/TadG family type IV pilus assembly protein [Devosia sp.]|uniref:TadE/TadG family type IV pilus assembly protein n=1 Tax=Devosia sp. TaxID=1871048 RepID=UPI002AFDF9E6|nr:TadE/TadG family type IV pilus assembly protein [Devosia sp.]